jgi:ribosome-associated protein
MAKSNASTGNGTRTRTKTGTAPRARKTTNGGAATAKPATRSATTNAAKPPAAKAAKPAARRGKLPKAVSGAVQAALDKKAEDVIVLDLRKADGFTDYFVICTGASARQITAIADGVRETLKRDFEERTTLAEGVDRSEWILLDYFNFVVHIFSRECRKFYSLERLWGNAERLEFTDEPIGRA